jgi:hypothetical protein
MATYVSLSELKDQALDQFVGITTHDTALTARLEQATAAVNKYLATTTNLAVAGASSARTIYGSGTAYLPLPNYVGAIASITTLDGYTVPYYAVIGGALVLTDSTGIILQPSIGGLSGYSWGTSTVWPKGLPYTITAAWGYDADTLAILKAVTLDLAVQLWRYRDAGGSETTGAEGAITTVRSGLTPLHKLMLDPVRDLVKGRTVGVF